MDPWYDYLALPLAPCLLALQAALRLTRWPRNVRLGLSAAVAGVIGAMLVYLLFFTPDVERDADIGGSLLLILWFGSLTLFISAFRQRA